MAAVARGVPGLQASPQPATEQKTDDVGRRAPCAKLAKSLARKRGAEPGCPMRKPLPPAKKVSGSFLRRQRASTQRQGDQPPASNNHGTHMGLFWELSPGPLAP